MRPTIIIILLTLGIPFCLLAAMPHDNSSNNSGYFKDGIIFRISIPQTGIYKISGQWLLEQTNLSNIQVNDIQISGLTGGALKHDSRYQETERIRPIPISVVNDASPSFDNQDYILFFAEGADLQYYDEDEGLFKLEKNSFAQQNFVFLKIAPQQEKNKLINESDVSLQGETSNEYVFSDFFHVDKVNLLDNYESTQGSGQKWYADELTNLPVFDLGREFSLPSGGLRAPRINVEFAGRSERRETIEVEFNDERFTEDFSPVNTGDIEALYARFVKFDITSDLLNSENALAIKFNKSNSEARLWLDFAHVQGTANAILEEEPLMINNLSFLHEEGINGLTIQSSNAISIWDITDPHLIVSKQIMIVGDNYAIECSNDEIKHLIAFSDDQVLTPPSIESVDNFDLIGNVDVDMIILSQDVTLQAAEKLRAHRMSQNFTSSIVHPQKIYDSYSGGKQDPTAIRNYVRDLYYISPRFNYLLLLGDASFDYRYINSQHPKTNLIPTFETFNSLDPLLAFPSDDYFALLDNDENGTLRGDLDINVGRLTVRNGEEAEAVVNKIISYDEKSEDDGRWRTNITFLADDEDNNLHINDAERIANEVSINYPLLNQNKIYFDAFRQESTPGGNRYPLATDKLNSTAERGALVINYLGHGGPNGWGQERVLKLDDINGWTNQDKLPLIITATCSFTGFDNPAITSAGEAALLNPTGGALSLFTTVRSVFASKNFQLTRAVFREIFEKEDDNFLRLGEIMRRAKNNNPNDNTNARKFFLIGDPSIRLSLPKLNIKTNKIGGVEISGDATSEQLSALDVVELEASVQTENGAPFSDYNGEVEIVVYDKVTSAQTIANDDRSFVKSFDTQQNIIYQGKAQVTSGKIKTTFTVPVDIDYQVGASKITYYSTSEERIEAAGFSNRLIIGGASKDPIIDDSPPSINAFLNDRSFINGDEVPNSNLVIVDIDDDFGLNLSSTGIGHEITATLDDDSQSTIFLNQFLASSSDNPRGGVILFNIENLSPGAHFLTVKAFDVANNFSEKTIDFIVSEDINRKISKIVNGPNPIKDETTFQIYHDLVDKEITVSMRVYDIQGRLVESLKLPNIPKDGISTITWAPKMIWQGTFVCYFTLESTISGESDISLAKKVILLK